MLRHEQLDALEKRWAEQNAPLTDSLRPGLALADIAGFEESVGRRLPIEARAWWTWHDGVAASGGPSVLRSMGGPDFEFLPLSEAVDVYRRQRRIAAEVVESTPGLAIGVDEFWHPGWFPLTTTRYGGVIACDCAVPPSEPTPIRMVHWASMEPPFEAATGSLGELVEWWIDALDRRAWRYSEAEGRWLLDYSRLGEPARELTRLV
jgi:cell wall assembly regulator SMI1